MHSMRVTESDMNMNCDIDDNISANFSMYSGNGLQEEYNYPDSMCGSTNGDFMSNNLLIRHRAKSPLNQVLGPIGAISPRKTLKPTQNFSNNAMKYNDSSKRLASNE